MVEKPRPSVDELLNDTSFKNELTAVLGDGPSEKQRDIINNLPDDLLVRMKGHLQENYVRQRKFGKSTEDTNEVGLIAGEFFEELIRADKDFPETTELSEELLGLLGNPERYRLENKLKLGRNPDLAFIEVDESTNTLIVEGIGEAKLGALNERALKQLSETGSTESVKKMVREVNKLSKKKLEGYGLSEVRERKTKSNDNKQHNVLEIDPMFRQVLVLPLNKREFDIDTTQRKMLLDTDLRENEYFQKKLDKVLEKTEIQYAAFDGKSVWGMAEKICERIQ